MDRKKVIKHIENFHKLYEKDFLNSDKYKNKQYLLNSIRANLPNERLKNAVFFILSYSFYRGRNDELSTRFKERAFKVLNEFFEERKDFLLESLSRIDKNELKKVGVYADLDSRLQNNGVNNKHDRLMILDLINFIQWNEHKNITVFLEDKIKSRSLQEAYKNLQNIHAIGPKVASLILRDLVYIRKLEKYLNRPDDYYYLQPVDIWVHRLSRKLGLVSREEIYHEKEARDITNRCFELGVNPIHYNQGIWYIGTQSLEILLKLLQDVNLESYLS